MEATGVSVIGKGIRRSLVILFVGLMVPGWGQQGQRFALLETGDYHGSDLKNAQPKHWLGIFYSGIHCEVRSTTVSTSPEVDEVAEDGPGVKSGVRVRTADTEAPAFLVRGLPLLPRKFEAAYAPLRDESADLHSGDRLELTGAAAGYWLEVTGKPNKEEAIPAGAQLILHYGMQQQVLYEMPKENNDGTVELVWVGDLDGDGKPDFLVNTSWHYNVRDLFLWLSTQAKPSQLVGRVARLRTTGC